MRKKRALLTEELAAKDFLNIVQELEELSRIAYRLEAYVSLWFSENTQDQAAQSLMARVEQFTAELVKPYPVLQPVVENSFPMRPLNA